MVNQRTPIATRKTKSETDFNYKHAVARIGRTIRAIRKLRAYTQQEVASRVGLSQNHLSNIETGNREPGIVLIAQLSRLFDVPVELLILPALEPSGSRPKDDRSLGKELQELLFSILDETAKEADK
jgi:transcriptional regulator with XRE-family HTH domain